jgi:hypothetical protein
MKQKNKIKIVQEIDIAHGHDIQVECGTILTEEDLQIEAISVKLNTPIIKAGPCKIKSTLN